MREPQEYQYGVSNLRADRRRLFRRRGRGLCCQGRQLGVRLPVLRLKFNHGRESGLRLRPPPEPTQRLSLAVVRLGRVIRREREGGLRMCQRLGMPPIAVGARGQVE